MLTSRFFTTSDEKEVDLTFTGKFNNQKPENAIHGEGLNVFRAVLKHEL